MISVWLQGWDCVSFWLGKGLSKIDLFGCTRRCFLIEESFLRKNQCFQFLIVARNTTLRCKLKFVNTVMNRQASKNFEHIPKSKVLLASFQYMQRFFCQDQEITFLIFTPLCSEFFVIMMHQTENLPTVRGQTLARRQN